MTDRTIVAIGCSADKDYAFLIPLTCLMWREVVGFEPFVLLAGSSQDWVERRSTVLAALTQHDIRPLVGVEIEGYPIGTIAQNVRQHASAFIDADSDWIITADADLWPLRREFYHQHEGFEGRAVSYYANGDHFQSKKDVLAKFDAEAPTPFQSIPTCHVAMRAGDWREIYQIEGNVTAATKRTLERMEPWLSRFAPEHQGLARWCCDQWYLTERLCRQDWFPDLAMPYPTPQGGRILKASGIMMIERYGHPPLDRLDRSMPAAWCAKFDPTRWTDAHLHKSPHEDSQWSTLLKVIDALIPKYSEWARKYREDFVRAS